MRNQRWKTLFALLFAFALVAAACSGDEEDTGVATEDTEASETTETTAADEAPDDTEAAADDDEAMEEDAMALDGTEVIITGPERSEDQAGAIQTALDAFGEETGISITYTGSADWESEINVQIDAGTPPDISVFPQPGKMADFAREGFLLPLPDDVNAAMETSWSDAWTVFGNVDGTQVGIPVKTDLKSIVWYKPATFEDKGYEVPTTFDQFVSLTADMIANGDTPLCLGVESGTATGWAYTDWVEEMVLRFEGIDTYNDWVSHDIPFNDPAIVNQMQAVLDLWNTDGMFFASGGTIASTNFGDNATPLVEEDCMMHRQASFFSGFFDDGVVFADGSPDAVDAFYFPANEGAPVLFAGTLVGAFEDRPEVWAVMEYMAGPVYAERRQIAQSELNGGGVSGFLSAVQGLDPAVYTPLEQGFLDILQGADVAGFDASDLMPADVGSGTFWTEGTSAINGDQDAQEAADKIEASWPS